MFSDMNGDFFFVISCKNEKNVVTLQSNPTLEGNMSCEKCFAKVLSLGRFLTY